MIPREQRRCPICGDGTPYALWIMDTAPEACAYDESHANDGPITVTTVTQCEYAMTKARQRAEWRKSAPTCFDNDGNMLPGKLGDVLEAWSLAYPGQELTL